MLLSGLAAACAHGQLAGRAGAFEDAKILFPESDVLCDRGDAHACSRLAVELTDWSEKPRLAEALDLHALSCDGGVSESCIHLDMLHFNTDPGARARMERRCTVERIGQACLFFGAETGDEAALRAGCELRASGSCRHLSQLLHRQARVETAREVLGQQCERDNGEACHEAADWTPEALAHVGWDVLPDQLVWYHRACLAGERAGCGRLALGVAAELLKAGPGDLCPRYEQALRTACRDGASCQADRFCRAAAGNLAARESLDRCDSAPDGEECALFLLLPRSTESGR